MNINIYLILVRIVSVLCIFNFSNVKKKYCYEPDPNCIPILEKNCCNINVDIEIIEKAITRLGGQVLLNISTSSRYNSVIKSHNFDYINSEKVHSMAFDEFYQSVKKNQAREVLIKVDIEGVESEFFEFLKEKNDYIGDIVVEGDNLPEAFGQYELIKRSHNDVYYYSLKTS